MRTTGSGIIETVFAGIINETSGRPSDGGQVLESPTESPSSVSVDTDDPLTPASALSICILFEIVRIVWTVPGKNDTKLGLRENRYMKEKIPNAK